MAVSNFYKWPNLPLKPCCMGVLQLATLNSPLQWGSEYRTSLVFKCALFRSPLYFIDYRSDSSTSSFHNPRSPQITWAPKRGGNFDFSSPSRVSPSRVTPSPEPLLPEVPVIVEAWTQINQIPGSAAVPSSTVQRRDNRYLLFFKCAPIFL